MCRHRTQQQPMVEMRRQQRRRQETQTHRKMVAYLSPITASSDG